MDIGNHNLSPNRLWYNRWQRKICTLSVQLYSDVTSVSSVFVSDKIINNIDNFRIKCLSYKEINCVFFSFRFNTFLSNLGKHVN